MSDTRPDTPLRRVELSPLIERNIESESAIIPKIKESGVVSRGHFFKVLGKYVWVITECEPHRGIITDESLVCLEGSIVQPLSQVQFIAIPPDPTEYTIEQRQKNGLFENVKNFLLSQESILIYEGLKFTNNDTQFTTYKIDPSKRFGICNKSTMIYQDFDNRGEFKRIDICPFRRTLPSSYKFDIFEDYLIPYFKSSNMVTHRKGNKFSFKGVRFKILETDPPNERRRVGGSTNIHSSAELITAVSDNWHVFDTIAPVNPSVRPPNEYIGHDQHLFERAGSSLGFNSKGIPAERIDSLLPKYKLCIDEVSSACAICRNDFEDGCEVRQLPCNMKHIFHPDCIDEWLCRSPECPVCRYRFSEHECMEEVSDVSLISVTLNGSDE
eukprot:GHVL01024173.1.p1 GENE.GHVL01024173.1~~GHVL01024173.1.p1  ORF type:complete len:384 (+),score=47.47 GHVL01024173.1:16-1167(+)